jgi:glycosyltransferase involved in cell wall biosynthesis
LTHTYGIAESKISVVPNGVREEFFIGSEARADSHTGPARLLFVGRLSPQKNLPRLLSAMAKISVDAELTIVGDGEERVALEKLQADLGLDNVRFVGRLTGPALIAWYRWADVFVLPSDKEGMPLVLLEAMAAALPIIATNVPGIRDTVGSDGVLVDPNPSALAAAIDRVVEDAVLRAQLAQGSFRRSQTLAWSDVIDQIKSVYADVSIQ